MKVLLTVASRHGSTRLMADCMREELEALGATAHVLEPDLVSDISRYDAVVIGSGVYAGRWLKPARTFAERFEGQLLQKPVWLFSSGPVGEPPKPTIASPDAVALAERLHAKEHRIFAGRLERSNLGFGERIIVRVVGAQEGDYRPWPEIAAWARSIADALPVMAPVAAASRSSGAPARSPTRPPYRSC